MLVERGREKSDEGANRANCRGTGVDSSRSGFGAAISAPAGIGGSRAIIDITCHVNIGYRRLPNLSAGEGPRQKGSARSATAGEIITCWF